MFDGVPASLMPIQVQQNAPSTFHNGKQFQQENS